MPLHLRSVYISSNEEYFRSLLQTRDGWKNVGVRDIAQQMTLAESEMFRLVREKDVVMWRRNARESENLRCGNI